MESNTVEATEGTFSTMMENPAEWWTETGRPLVTGVGASLLYAILIFVIGRMIAKWIRKVIQNIMERANVEPALIGFSTALTYAAVMVFVVLAALGQLGIQTTSFIAVLGAAGLAIGLALQGSLANFAAGVLMLIFRPFKVGDYIEGAGTAGSVTKIHIFTTMLTTPDNKIVIVPNSKMMGDNITNYSASGTRRLDLVACISYDDDIDKAKTAMADLLAADERLLKDPAPTIGVLAMNDSSIDIAVRPWVKTSDYWDVYFDLTEAIKKRLEAEGCSIPYPQRDVHVYKHEV